MVNKNLEIIDVTMSIDIVDEIKKKVDSLSTELVEHTKKVIKKRMKVQKVNQKKLRQDKQVARAQKVLDFLEQAFEKEDLWVEGKHLLQAADLPNTPQNINKMSLHLRRLLEKEDKWTLSKRRKTSKTSYRLTRFS